ncbi:hypothetical protein K432DRAFT_289445 [Lepidopterella palustris CBS 459.81]|uniref:DNA repair protein Rad26 n=1 Tax=Lepidopterella palustris CBS 459.81 TaxID=1314670 RepID=A0A8E2EI29_9PEZI|nr:hypothetical protein K432DRAFT_289445 [Lepidopterella palustris CBS 459.81]
MADKDEDDEFEFNDHDLDELPDNALRELETNAILSTQRQQAAILNRANATNYTHPFVQIRNVGPSNAQAYNAARPSARPEPPSSDYGFDDDDEIVIDLDEQSLPADQVYDSNPTGPTGWVGFPHEPAQLVPSAPPLQDGYPSQIYPSNLNYSELEQFYESHGGQEQVNNEYNRVEGSYIDNMEVDGEMCKAEVDTSKLLQRIQELEQERARLVRSVEEAKSTAMAKAGEIAIVRRNHDKATKEYERRIAVMQQAHADVVAKQKAELEKTKKERESIKTNNLFLQNDLAREAEKSKNSRKAVKGGAPNKLEPVVAGPAATPKKHKNLPFRDGFDDEDIMVSPSKARDRPKASTPKLGGKRKRQVVDQSPVQPLQLSEPRERSKPPEPVPELDIDPALLARLRKEDERFEFLQRLLNHRPSGGHERTLEALTKHTFPSNPDKMLSSLVYDELSPCTFAEDENQPLKFCNIFLSIWDQCLKERYFAPLNLLIDALQYILARERMATAVSITEKAVPLILASVDLVAIPIGRAQIDKASILDRAQIDKATIPDRDTPAQLRLRQEIDVLECLALLHTIATSCSATSLEAITKFWQMVQFDSILINLMKSQPLPQLTLMLRILSTSALPTTFGAIIPDSRPGRQSEREADTIGRLTNLLFETPEVPQTPNIRPKNAGADADLKNPSASPHFYSRLALCDLRLQVLHVLGALCIHSHGGLALARHTHAIGRIVRFLHDQIDALYDHTNSSTHSLVVASVNLSMRLFYHLVTTFPNDIDIKVKLDQVKGGSHKHLVALTRLAFSESLVLEGGIEDEVVDAAHQLLDEYLSPEEGEALLQVFSSGRSVMG